MGSLVRGLVFLMRACCWYDDYRSTDFCRLCGGFGGRAEQIAQMDNHFIEHVLWKMET